MDAVFVAAMLFTAQGQSVAWSRAGLTALPILKKSAWAEIEVPWPDRAERFRLAAVVAGLDMLLQSSAEAAEVVRRARKGAVRELLEGGHHDVPALVAA
jgi:hypothetical protein